MRIIYRYLSVIFLAATLVGPVCSYAASLAKSNPVPIKKLKDDDDKKKARRYYDRKHKDSHEWNEREEAAYRRWLEEERHEQYRDFARQNAARQSEYWEWRHEHPDRD